MKEKKMILIALISGGAVLLALAAGLAAYIGSASGSAAEAARAFEALLSEGKLAELEVRCYLPEEGQTMVFPEQGGDVQVRSVTPAELAERFGADAVLAGQETSLEEELLSADERRVFITHSGCDREVIDQIHTYLENMGRFREILVTRAGGVISSHCGPGTLGVLFYVK